LQFFNFILILNAPRASGTMPAERRGSTDGIVRGPEAVGSGGFLVTFSPAEKVTWTFS
jgi:hypothetical protein